MIRKVNGGHCALPADSKTAVVIGSYIFNHDKL